MKVISSQNRPYHAVLQLPCILWLGQQTIEFTGKYIVAPPSGNELNCWDELSEANLF